MGAGYIVLSDWSIHMMEVIPDQHLQQLNATCTSSTTWKSREHHNCLHWMHLFFVCMIILWQLHSYWTFRFLHNHAPISGQITWILCHLNSSTMCSLLLFVLVSSHVLFYVFLHLFYPVFCESCSSFMYPVYHVYKIPLTYQSVVLLSLVYMILLFYTSMNHSAICPLSGY